MSYAPSSCTKSASASCFKSHQNSFNVHPSSFWQCLSCTLGCRRAALSPSCLGAKAGLHLVQVSSSSQGKAIHYGQFTVANQAHVRVFTCRVPKQTLEEYRNSTQKDPRWQSNLWPSCCEATVPAANSSDISDHFLLKVTIHQELKTTTVIMTEA